MKTLKFFEPLPKLILEEKKNTTWRVNDEKNISVGNIISLIYINDSRLGQEFARAKVINVKETTFGNLTDEDKQGHEKFSSDEDMYETYSRYYHMKVTPKTKVKIIKFRLIQHIF